MKGGKPVSIFPNVEGQQARLRRHPASILACVEVFPHVYVGEGFAHDRMGTFFSPMHSEYVKCATPVRCVTLA